VIKLAGNSRQGDDGEGGLMALFILVIAVTAFLLGAALAVFVMLVVGIRKADRP
jgi:hypothetical protein